MDFDAQREVVMSWIVACAAICALVGGATLWQMGRGDMRPLLGEAWVVAAPLQGAQPQRSSGEGHLPLIYDRSDGEPAGPSQADGAPGT